MSELINPDERPKQTKDITQSFLAKNGVYDQAAILGVRGYYKKSLGDSTLNDRGIYDDAIFLWGLDFYNSYSANCDPSFYEQGIANLKAGVWRYKLGIHNVNKPKSRQYKALVQEDPVTVLRDGGKEETGFFGINIHKGSINSTSSMGCQTIFPSQWDEFILSVQMLFDKYSLDHIKYCLVEY